MLPLITMRDGRKLGLSQTHAVPVSLTVSVLRAMGTYTFNFTVYVQPKDTGGNLGTSRLATSGECECRVQHPNWNIGGGNVDYAVAQTDANGKAVISLAGTLFKLDPTIQYQVTAKHRASGAEIGARFTIDASGNVSGLQTPYVINAGSTQAATFQQSLRRIGALRQSRPVGGIAFPEVRSWPTSGPNPAMPGTLVRVRQDDGGPAYRQTMV